MRHAARRLAAPSRGAEALVLKFVENGRPFDVTLTQEIVRFRVTSRKSPLPIGTNSGSGSRMPRSAGILE